MKHKILIVDDEESIRNTLGRVFGDHSVFLAGDGAAAMRIIEAERPSVVLLDLSMPVMSGLEVLCAFKGVEDVPLFIILTGDGELDTALKAIGMGAADYVTKPFRMEVIRKVVLCALGEIEGSQKGSSRPWKVKRNGDDFGLV